MSREKKWFVYLRFFIFASASRNDFSSSFFLADSFTIVVVKRCRPQYGKLDRIESEDETFNAFFYCSGPDVVREPAPFITEEEEKNMKSKYEKLTPKPFLTNVTSGLNSIKMYLDF